MVRETRASKRRTGRKELVSARRRAADFFATTPVFRTEEFAAYQDQAGSANVRTREALLAYHVARGHLQRVRRGLYAVVPPGISPAQHEADPYLVISKLTPDAVVAYHAALQFHGKAYSVQSRYPYLTRHASAHLVYGGAELVAVRFPVALTKRRREKMLVKEHRHHGGVARVASLERTLVDVLDRPDLGGGWEELWRSLASVEFFDLDAVIAYAEALGSATTTAKVGFFLEAHAERLMVQPSHLARLEKCRPGQPRYVQARRRGGRFIRRWNLIVPAEILPPAWDEGA